ncbi:MAG TPA: phosphatase PAP2-related protein [Vicinamibacterales bacterium]|nr:phosphatase PAP2-related protein [Vicinamibacterales bacterium]
MNGRAKSALLLALLAGIVASVWPLATGHATEWAPGLSASLARLLFRSLTIAFGLGAWFLSQSLIAARGFGDGTIGDAVHGWTAPMHDWLARHPPAANALLVTSSGFIDAFGLFLLGASLFGPSLRPGIGLLLVFALRQIAQLTCALPMPPGMIWRHPGVPSLLVTYDVANDYFFSGHTAIAVLGAIEAAKIAPPWVALAAATVACLEALTVLVLRAHWTMDVLTGAVAACCAAGIAATICAGF